MQDDRLTVQALSFAVWIVVLVVVAQLCAQLGLVPSYILPAPTEVFWSMVEHPHYYARHFSYTASAALGGLVLAVAFGLVLGVSATKNKFINIVFSPFIVGSQVFPKEALAPLIVLIFGYGISSKIVVSFSLAFFPIIAATTAGLKAVSGGLKLNAAAASRSTSQIFFEIELPGIFPYLIAGLKMAFVFCVIGAVVGEFVGSTAGLGYAIRGSLTELAPERVFACLGLLGVLGGGFYFFLVVLERTLFWRYTHYTGG